MRSYYVYILSNASRTLYVGVTGDLERRMHEHRSGTVPGFTRRYRLTQLVYYERHVGPGAAIEREKALKGRLRSRKIALIESVNPEWKDLTEGPTPEMEALEG
jgi:putative endonuclease